MDPQALLWLILSSPSGAGKSTLARALTGRFPELRVAVSHTTREPRGNERSGREYHFVSRERFRAMVEAGLFLEWAEVHGNWYGTSRSETAGKARVIFDVDHQGARRLRALNPDAVTVFVLPPDLPTLRERLRARGCDTDETIARRYDAALGEVSHYGLFDYLVVNDDLGVATEQLVSIVAAELCRSSRSARAAEQLLALKLRAVGGDWVVSRSDS